MAPLLTLITPTYNAAATVVGTLRSLDRVSLNMRSKVEVVIADDGSTDNTLDIVAKHAEAHPDFEWRVLSLPHAGVSATRNAALDAANGTWVMFLDADDELEEDVTHSLAADANATCHLFATSYSRDGKTTSRRAVAKLSQCNALDELTAGNPLPISSIVFRRELMDRRFSPEISFGEDWLFWAGNRRFFDAPVEHAEVSSIVHIHAGNTSRDLVHAGVGREQVAQRIEEMYAGKLTRKQVNNLRLQRAIGRLLQGRPIGTNLTLPLPCSAVLLAKYAAFLAGRLGGKSVTRYR